MEFSVKSIAFSIVIVTVVTWACKILNWAWLKPKKLEKQLRRQGFRGNSYRFLFGDVKEHGILSRQAKSKPISLDDDIAPRVVPLYDQREKLYGKNTYWWIGPIPMINIMDPDQIKELMLPAFYQSCTEIISKWEKLMIGDQGSCELDVWPYLVKLTSDVISRTAFGSNYEEGIRIFQLQTELADIALQALQSVYIPGWRYVPTKRNRRMKELDKEIRVSLADIIRKREIAMKTGEAAKDDLLGLLMESNLKEIKEHGNNKLKGISRDDVIDECKLFYFAGQETTSVLLLWTMVLLSKHQDWQAHAREEVLQVLGDKKPDFDGLNRLKIVQMIFYEVLRLYPPLPVLSRYVEKETKIGDLILPAESVIALQTLLVHHDKKLWGDDAKEFKPERFSEGISKATKNQVSYFPFSWGPRICIGQNFALVEAKMAMAMILQNFSFELSPSYVHAPHAFIFLQPQHGVYLILRKL
ncbi:cytochrome P450 72A15 [Citrus sinensis]|uniref:Cytochrome P450 72A15 n=1 Tax=Citrus sinensis TaxID=2711 RepID=A0ACB8M278_CITSI|nr:cytochrome P450 72A15 [Citrus sinensis]